MKICKVCERELALEHFQRDSKSRDGYHRRCKTCTSEYRKKSVTRKEANKRYRQDNRDKRRATDKAYYAANKERYQLRDYIRRERLESSLSTLTREDRDDATEYISVLLGDPCVFCGNSAAQIDHIIPITNKGTSHWYNLSAACEFCNKSKGSKELLQFMLYRLAA